MVKKVELIIAQIVGVEDQKSGKWLLSEGEKKVENQKEMEARPWSVSEISKWSKQAESYRGEPASIDHI